MELRELSETASELIALRKFDDAEVLLLQAHETARREEDRQSLEIVLPLLVELYSCKTPPDLQRAEEYSREREEVSPAAYTQLQTGLLEYFVARDLSKAAFKLQAAVKSALEQKDDRTHYSSLSFLGAVLVDAGRNREAREILREISLIADARRPVVWGDETLFLEKMIAAGLAVDAVRSLAAAIVPMCRDAEFRNRLENLAASRNG